MSGWAYNHITNLRRGQTVSFRPRGNSMSGRIESGQLVTVEPLNGRRLEKGDIVLCSVLGNQYLHLVAAIKGDLVQIKNNKGHINGWTPLHKIYGICIRIES